MTARIPIDRDAAMSVAVEIGRAVVAHYNGHPPSRAVVFEVLNALAAITARVIAGTGPDQECVHAWFEEALCRNLAADQTGDLQ